MKLAHKNLLLADQFRVNKQPERALEFLKRVDAATLDTHRFWFVRGQSLFQLKRFQEALQDTEKGLSLAPQDIDLLWLRGKCKWVLGDLRVAEQSIQTALSQWPTNVVLLCEMAVIRARQRNLQEAEEMVAKAAHQSPDHPSIAWARLHIADNRRNYKELEQRSREALSADPDYAFGHYMLGHALLRQRKVTDSHHAFQTAARLAPTDPDLTLAARQSQMRTRWFMRPLQSRYYFVFLFLTSLVFTAIFLGQESVTQSGPPDIVTAFFAFLGAAIFLNMLYISFFIACGLIFVIFRSLHSTLQSLIDRLR